MPFPLERLNTKWAAVGQIGTKHMAGKKQPQVMGGGLTADGSDQTVDEVSGTLESLHQRARGRGERAGQTWRAARVSLESVEHVLSFRIFLTRPQPSEYGGAA